MICKAKRESDGTTTLVVKAETILEAEFLKSVAPTYEPFSAMCTCLKRILIDYSLEADDYEPIPNKEQARA